MKVIILLTLFLVFGSATLPENIILVDDGVEHDSKPICQDIEACGFLYKPRDQPRGTNAYRFLPSWCRCSEEKSCKFLKRRLNGVFGFSCQ